MRYEKNVDILRVKAALVKMSLHIRKNLATTIYVLSSFVFLLSCQAAHSYLMFYAKLDANSTKFELPYFVPCLDPENINF